jgi:PAS domain S-box-containing protein
VKPPRRWVLTRGATAGYSAALLLFVASGVASWYAHLLATEAGGWTLHTLNVLDRADRLLEELLEAKAGLRGYLVTGAESYFQQYVRAAKTIPAELELLRELIGDNPAQRDQHARLVPMVQAELAELQRTIELRRQKGPEALPSVGARAGIATMDGIRGALREFRSEERRQLRTRKTKATGRRDRVSVFIVLGTLFGAALVPVTLLGQNRQAWRRAAAERMAREEKDRLHITLQSVGDAVMAADLEGRVTLMNPVAEELTGWRFEEANGRPITEVFRIINEETRAAVESPVAKVLREGAIVGLANHTMLISNEGREIPIQDSAAPIRDADGKTSGVVLVFQDASDRRRAEHERDLLTRSEAARAEAVRNLRERDVLLRAAELARTESERAAARVKRLIDSNIVGVFFVRGDTLVEANEAFLSLVGYSRADLEAGRMSWRALSPSEYLRLDEHTLAQIEQRGACASIEREYLRKDGTRVAVLMGGTQIRSLPFEWAGFVIDLTARNQTLDALRAAREEAAAANRSKDEFLANLSHELRSPLNAMVVWMSILKRGPTGSKLERAVDTLERNIFAQAKLVDDLLDISRIASGKLIMEEGPVDLGVVVETGVEIVRPMADAEGIELAHSISESPCTVMGDGKRLRQVVENLLGNALKFTRRGGRVTVALRPHGEEAALEVADTGVGIAPEFLPVVFERFRQADDSSARRHGGLGLGLSIVKTLVEMHHGRVEARSEGVGKGATFIVYLPRSSKQPALPVASPDPGTRELQGAQVMLVEDDADNRRALCMLLEESGAHVYPCDSVDEALSLMNRVTPDLIVSDIALRGEDGYSFLKKVRARESSHIPAIAMTGLASKEDREMATKSGFDDHVAKPVEPKALIGRASQLIRQARIAPG